MGFAPPSSCLSTAHWDASTAANSEYVTAEWSAVSQYMIDRGVAVRRLFFSGTSRSFFSSFAFSLTIFRDSSESKSESESTMVSGTAGFLPSDLAMGFGFGLAAFLSAESVLVSCASALGATSSESLSRALHLFEVRISAGAWQLPGE